MLTDDLTEHNLRVGLAVLLGNLRADGIGVSQRPEPLQRRQLELGTPFPSRPPYQSTAPATLSTALIVRSPERRGASRVSRSSARARDSAEFARAIWKNGSTIVPKACSKRGIRWERELVGSEDVCADSLATARPGHALNRERPEVVASCEKRYDATSGIGGFERITMYSVEPHPTSSASRKSTNAVFPFSRHGVIRAIKVSPFTNRIPDPVARQTQLRGACPAVGIAAISR